MSEKGRLQGRTAVVTGLAQGTQKEALYGAAER
jgi:hypothetical protein